MIWQMHFYKGFGFYQKHKHIKKYKNHKTFEYLYQKVKMIYLGKVNE
jgi:hypothetical protein